MLGPHVSGCVLADERSAFNAQERYSYRRNACSLQTPISQSALYAPQPVPSITYTANDAADEVQQPFIPAFENDEHVPAENKVFGRMRLYQMLWCTNEHIECFFARSVTRTDHNLKQEHETVRLRRLKGRKVSHIRTMQVPNIACISLLHV